MTQRKDVYCWRFIVLFGDSDLVVKLHAKYKYETRCHFSGIFTVFILDKLDVAHGRAAEERLADGAHGSSAFGCLLLVEPTRHP